MKKVAILMATYNGEKYIKEQIDSIINQTYNNWTLYISDDGSSDKTNKIINSYIKKHKNKIIRVEDGKHLGAKMNFNNLFTKVSGYDYYMFSDQDDYWEKDKIKKLIEFCNSKKTEKPLLVYSDIKVVDENLNVIKESLIISNNSVIPENPLKKLLVENYFPGNAIIFNNELKEKVKCINEKSEMHDWWVTIVAALTGDIYYYDEPLVRYRQHGNNVLGAHLQNESNIKIYMNKLKNIGKTLNTWHEYQKQVVEQTNELIKKYCDEEQIKDAQLFVHIMNKPRIIRLFSLINNGYIHRKKIRILRLVI